MSTGASGAANAMDEVFGDFGQVVVDDVGDVLHVNSARGDVGGDQDAITSLLEAGQGPRCVAIANGRHESWRR